MARSKFSGAAPAALLVFASLIASGEAADLCEGCWEFGGRAGWQRPSPSTGVDPALSAGVTAGFRFRPFWSLEASLDHSRSSISDGPGDSLTTFASALTYTFRAAREQRTRPFVAFLAGLARESVDSQKLGVSTGSGTLQASSSSANDLTILYGIGAGGLTSLRGPLWLRFEGRLFRYDTFGLSQSAVTLSVGFLRAMRR